MLKHNKQNPILFRVAQKLLLFNSNKEVLVLQASKNRQQTPVDFRGKCDFPGGGLNIIENLNSGLAREIKEELNDVKFKKEKLIYVWDWIHQSLDGQKYRTVCLLFQAKYLNGAIKLSKEHDQYYWLKIKDLHKYNWHKTELKTIRFIQKFYA